MKRDTLENVETLRPGGSVAELAIDLIKMAEADDALDAVVVVRGPDGALMIEQTPMNDAEIGEMAIYLSAHAQREIWNASESPEMLREDEDCDED